ncbi:MAG: AbrB family transcriptional regulator [Betaproteobacteria bacterium]|nr:AbrB family transcriptional regulator [Betaproteobacteria bacterium]
MPQSFKTRQFMAGNSPAVRIPMNMAFPDKTELVVIREGNRIIVEAAEESLQSVPELLLKVGKSHSHKRPVFIEAERKWQD